MASVTYKIGGKYDGKGIKSAKKDLSDLATVVKGLAVVKVAQQLNKIAQATKGVFVEQNKALTSFNVSVAKSGIELKKINDIKKELSHGNFIDDDSINNAMKLGMQMGLNAEQLEKVTKTAIDMASSGVKPLDKAMKELSKTALTNSEEFEKISANYDGFADAMSKTFSGRDAQWKNSLADLQASIGAIPKSLEFLTQGKLLEPLNKITDWIVTNRNSIINFFLNLPQIFVVVGKSFTNMFKKTFENLPEWFSNIGVYFVQIFKDGFNTIFNVGKEVFNGWMTLLDYAIGNPFRSSKNFINTMLNNLIEGINSLVDKLPDWAKKLFGVGDDGAIKYRFEVGQNGDNKTWTETAQAIEKSMSNVIKAYKDGAKKTKDDWLKVLDASTKFYSSDINAMKDELAEILGKDLPEELQMALDGITFTPSTDDDGISATESEKSKLSGASVIGSTALSGAGEIGSIVSSVIQNGVWGAIAEILAKILKRVEEVSPLFAYFQNIISEIFNVLIDTKNGFVQALENFIQPFLDGFNAVKDILGGFLQFIGGILNSIASSFEGTTMILNKIAPLISTILSILGVIGDLIGIIGQMLNPIVEVVMTVIAPILDAIMYVIKGVHYLIATIVNWVIDIYNKIAWKKVGHISTDIGSTSSAMGGYDSMTPDLSNYASASASATSGNAHYSAPKDIYLNVIFEHSFVNADGREVALMIRDELQSAEKLGY
ncbi:MAG: hypothetical protein MJZ03_03365 [archaeon]|nr:hypothetical protein [archaeon]